MLAACLMTQGSRIAPVSIGLGKANQLASSKTLAKPNLRADCVVAFEQAWGRVEDVVGGGERPQVKPSLALESRSLGVGRRARARGELRRGAEVGYCGGVTFSFLS